MMGQGGMGRPHSFRPPPMAGNPQPGMNSAPPMANTQNRMAMDPNSGAVYGGPGARGPLSYQGPNTPPQMPAGLPQAANVGAPMGPPPITQARQYSGAMPPTGVVQPPPPIINNAPGNDPNGDWMSNYYNQYRRQRMGWQNQ